jgi:hypothetical protein
LLGSGEARVRGLEMSTMRSSSAFWVSSVQWKESDFFNNLYRGAAFPQLRYEMAEDREASHKSLDILDIPDLAYFRDGRVLIIVYFDATLGDDVPQELAPGDPKGALFRVQLDVEVLEVSEGFFQVNDDERLGPDLPTGRGKSIGIDLDVDHGGSEQNFKLRMND